MSDAREKVVKLERVTKGAVDNSGEQKSCRSGILVPAACIVAMKEPEARSA